MILALLITQFFTGLAVFFSGLEIYTNLDYRQKDEETN